MASKGTTHTNSALKQETGLEFLLRMRPYETYHETHYGDFSTHDFILLSTPCANSKACMITKFISQVILPEKFGGFERRILLLDLDYNLNMLNVLERMEKTLKALKLPSSSCDKTVSSSPSRLKVIRPCNNTELYVTLSSIRELIQNENISILVCDNSSLYNQDSKVINFMYSTLHSLPRICNVAVVFACYVIPEMTAIKFPKPADIVWSMKKGEDGHMALTTKRLSDNAVVPNNTAKS